MRFAILRLLTAIRSTLACRRGQVAIIFAFAVTMLFVAVGMGLDLWQAYAVKARLQSGVDAAALALASTDRTSYSNPQDPFLVARVEGYVAANYPAGALGTPGTPVLSYGATNDIIIVTDTASVPTTFMRVIGVDTLSIGATGQAKAAWSNIDFYLMVDTSPSMGIAATAAGITTMVNNTLQQCDTPPSGAGNPTCGCGFACHETTPGNETQCSPAWSSTVSYAIGNYVYLSNNTYKAVTANKNHTPPNTTYWSASLGSGCPQPGLGNAGGVDNYRLSQNLGVTLRIDDLRTAVAQLMTTAQNTETTYNLTNAFRMAIYSFDVHFNNGVSPGGPIIQSLTSDLSTAAAAAAASAPAGIQELTMCQNNSTLINGTCTGNNDADTNYAQAMTGINAIMPMPGHGTKSPGDTPKEVLLLVTDGIVDEAVASCTPSATVNCDGGSGSGTRQMSVIDTSLCDAIKNKGAPPNGQGPLIAVLYLEYDALPTNGWYNNHVSPYNQPPPPTGIPPSTPTPVETALQNCASSVSSGPLYAKVVEGGDISAALSNLFNQAVNAVFLSK
jgi:hypothetical protein